MSSLARYGELATYLACAAAASGGREDWRSNDEFYVDMRGFGGLGGIQLYMILYERIEAVPARPALAARARVSQPLARPLVRPAVGLTHER